MSWFLVHIIGIISGGLGMILTFVITIMPQWRVSILAENNGINGRIDGYWISRWDGLWTTCVNQARLAMQCNSYESQVSLTMDLKSGRILMSFAILMTLFAFIFSVLGLLMHRCNQEEGRLTKNCLRLTAGLLYIFSTILIAIPVIWTCSNILRKAYDADICRGALRIEMGEALFLAWPTMVLVLIAGIILTCHCIGNPSCMPSDDKSDYVQPRDQQMIIMRSIPDDRPNCTHRSQYI